MQVFIGVANGKRENLSDMELEQNYYLGFSQVHDERLHVWQHRRLEPW